MPTTAQVEAARADYAKTLPTRGVDAALQKPDARKAISVALRVCRRTVIRTRAALISAYPDIAALVTDAELSAMVECAWRHR